MTGSEATSRQRSYLEAGLFGCAVIHGVAGAVMLAGSLFVSVGAGNFVLDEFTQAGFFVLALAGGYWLLGRLAARTLDPRDTADCEPDAGSP